jgi:hypothetical protein
MNELIESKIEELHSLLMDKPNQVLAIFNDFFGEDKVDMQGFMSVDELKLWFDMTPISEYALRDSLGMSKEDYNIYGGQSLTNLRGEVLDLVLNQLCSRWMVNNIGCKKFGTGFILVHFPHVRITNEHGRFVDINHLYAKVMVLHNGSINGYFALNRSEYTYLHISNRYMHSHVSDIPTSNFTLFQTPCTGDGPINATISNLSREFDPDIWKLFCLELSKYVEVESIAGVPYHRLENLGTSNMSAEESVFKVINRLDYYEYGLKKMIKDFVSYFIKQGKLKFNYANGSYSIGMSYTEYILIISNEFIDWYNKKFNNKELRYTFNTLKWVGVLKKCIIANNRIYYEEYYRNANSYAAYNGKRMCTFKGTDVLINITDLKEVKENNKSVILNTKTALYILSKILRVINYRYGKTEQKDQEGNRISEEVRYF